MINAQEGGVFAITLEDFSPIHNGNNNELMMMEMDEELM